jgi:orotidine-5'-phosphate decarboxylase
VSAEHCFDRLARRIAELRAPLAVGIDPHWELLPDDLKCRSPAEGLERYALGVVGQVADLVPAVKVQFAFFERWGSAGWRVLERTCREARGAGLFVIADAKRGDIASTAQAYADGILGEPGEGGLGADAVTLNPYLGRDALEPFLRKAPGQGVFVLVRTTNPSSKEVQELDVKGRPLHLRVAERVREWGSPFVGSAGFSSVGAVVGATDPKALSVLRGALKTVFFLIPGFGAQGGTVDGIKEGFLPSGRGAIVSASRSIGFAFREDPWKRSFGEGRWEEGVRASTRETVERLGSLFG